MYTNTPPLMPGRAGSFRTQLLITLGFLSVLVTIVAASALSNITLVRSSAREAVTIDGRLSQLTSEIATQTLESRRYEKDFFLNIGDARERSNYLAKWQASATMLDKDIAAFAGAATTAEDLQQVTIWRAQLAQYSAHFLQIAGMAEQGRLTTPQEANTAFTPFKENIRLLTESAVAVADRKATRSRVTSASLDARGARTTGQIVLLATLALMVIGAYGATGIISFSIYCDNCAARLPISRWFGGAHQCRQCELRRLADLIDETEERNRSV